MEKIVKDKELLWKGYIIGFFVFLLGNLVAMFILSNEVFVVFLITSSAMFIALFIFYLVYDR